MKKPFTGRHMTMLLVGGFGIVIAVNFYMASHAISGFGGVVVPNSYVASQEFNGWLEEAEKQDALGWSAKITRADDGALAVQTEGAPDTAQVSAMIRRPLGVPEMADIAFSNAGAKRYVSAEPIAQGRWIVRLTIEDGVRAWSTEQQIQ
jgi:nitrogen fixation protein FixH